MKNCTIFKKKKKKTDNVFSSVYRLMLTSVTYEVYTVVQQMQLYRYLGTIHILNYSFAFCLLADITCS